MLNERKSRQAGFSLVELLMVMAITLIVVAISIPITSRTIKNFQMRSSASAFADMLHTARMRAVKLNSIFAVQEVVPDEGGAWAFYVDVDGDEEVDEDEKLVTLYNGVVRDEDDVPDVDTMGFEGALMTDWPPRFNSRGLPCAIDEDDGLCKTVTDTGPVGFVYFVANAEQNMWVAITISPSGRINTWNWSSGSEEWTR
jgi:prepilin-type N-terminal cleavage/methylation domain-containing protein